MSRKRTTLDSILAPPRPAVRPEATVPVAERPASLRPGVKQQTVYLPLAVYEQLRRDGFDPRAAIAASPALARAIELIDEGVFSLDDPARFRPLLDDLRGGDHFLVTADFEAYRDTQAAVGRAFAEPRDWQARAVRNIAGMARFSSDRTIRGYAGEIWRVPGIGSAAFTRTV